MSSESVNKKKKKGFGEFWDRYSTISILIIMTLVFGIMRFSSFFTGSNMLKIL